MKSAILAATALIVMATLSACGGGGNNPPPPPPTTTVTVSPATANVQEGSTQQFTATVTNSSSTTVNWQVNGIAGGNASVGTIDSTGLYTAPDAIPNPASVTVTAVLQVNNAISSNAIVTVTAVQFGLSSLTGNYIFSLSGIDTNGNAFYAVGAIASDGNGNITGGEEDLNDSTAPAFGGGYSMTTAINGTYTLGSDGRGILNLNSSLGQFSYAFAMRALSNAGLNEIDNAVINATGNLEQQTAGGVTAPSGNYAFGFAGSALCGTGNLTPINSNGIFSLSGTTVGGLQDQNCNGTVVQSQTLTGNYTGIDSMGRGSGAFSSTNTGNPDFVYYVVSANRYRFMCPDSATFFLGAADVQTQPSFTGSNFSGNYVISISDNTAAGVSYTLMEFKASSGSAANGAYDVNDTGAVSTSSLSGAYSLSGNGYINGTFNVSSGALPFSMYLVSPTQAYYLDLRTNAVGGGNVYAQASAVTSNADWAGSYATKQFGYFVTNIGISPANSTSVSGQISANGNGSLAGTLDFNDPTNVFQNQTLQGTYNVGTNAPGRMTVTITTGENGGTGTTRTYIGYIVDQTRVQLLEVDPGLTGSGDAIRQF
ncbi:MAG: hypothetical protein WA655_02405 [Candidatus Korobacteraceae bacterium]